MYIYIYKYVQYIYIYKYKYKYNEYIYIYIDRSIYTALISKTRKTKENVKSDKACSGISPQACPQACPAGMSGRHVWSLGWSLILKLFEKEFKTFENCSYVNDDSK